MSRLDEPICIVGVATHTVRDRDAPEPLDLWADAIRAAAHDAGNPALLRDVDSLTTTYCQTWQYDDPTARLADELGIEPRHRHYQPIGGTSGQQLVDLAARRIRAGESDIVAIASAEALATQAASRKRGEQREYRFKPETKRPFPFEAPLHPQETAADLLSALNAFALFDSARRAHRGVALDDHRRALAEMFAPMSEVAARNPDAWFPTARTADAIVEARPDNRMTAYPYTKYMVAVMDVDMAAAVVVMSESAANRLAIDRDRRVYLRGSAYLTDPVYVAQHRELHHSPAMRRAAQFALNTAGVHLDDVALLDIYSCFGSSLFFACDALGIAPDDSRGLTVTGGLPYHGGPGSGYMVHSIAAITRRLREARGSALVSGVGMINTKHTFGVYSCDPPNRTVEPPPAAIDLAAEQTRLDDENGPIDIVDDYTGEATILALTVVHGRDGAARHGIAVVELDAEQAGSASTPRRAYARFLDPDMLVAAEQRELVGARAHLVPHPFTGVMGEQSGHLARLV